MNKLLSLRELLGDKSLPFDHHVLLPTESEWHLDTLCAIVESDEITEPENHPLALENKFSSSIGTNEVLDIIANASAQISQATAEQLLAAFEFYYNNDAFIVFGDAR
jgi:hypothetical protein